MDYTILVTEEAEGLRNDGRYHLGALYYINSSTMEAIYGGEVISPLELWSYISANPLTQVETTLPKPKYNTY